MKSPSLSLANYNGRAHPLLKASERFVNATTLSLKCRAVQEVQEYGSLDSLGLAAAMLIDIAHDKELTNKTRNKYFDRAEQNLTLAKNKASTDDAAVSKQIKAGLMLTELPLLHCLLIDKSPPNYQLLEEVMIEQARLFVVGKKYADNLHHQKSLTDLEKRNMGEIKGLNFEYGLKWLINNFAVVEEVDGYFAVGSTFTQDNLKLRSPSLKPWDISIFTDNTRKPTYKIQAKSSNFINPANTFGTPTNEDDVILVTPNDLSTDKHRCDSPLLARNIIAKTIRRIDAYDEPLQVWQDKLLEYIDKEPIC